MLLSALLCMVSCQSDDLPEAPAPDASIWLSAAVATTSQADTRVPYNPPKSESDTNPYSAPTSNDPFDAAIAASTSGNFTVNNINTTTDLEILTSVFFESGENQLLRGNGVITNVIYPTSTTDVSPVKFIGLHPNAGWSFSSGATNSAPSYTFQGKEDLLYAPQVTGYYLIPSSSYPCLHFYHLLTWLRVEVYVDEGAESSWGNITSMTLPSKTTLNVNIQSASVPELDVESGTGKVWFTGASSNINFWATGTDPEVAFGSTPYALTTTPTEVAYVLCEPLVATAEDGGDPTNEYVITVNTTNRSNVTVNVDLKSDESTYFTGSTMGRQFVIQLKFGAGGYVSASALVTEWGVGGFVTKDITE